MSLLSRLLPRAGHGTTGLIRPKGITRMETAELAQPLHRVEHEEARPLRRMDQDEDISPLRRDPLVNRAEEKEAQPLQRMEEEDAQPLRRTEDKEARPLHRTDDEARPLHRAEVEDEAHPLHRAQVEDEAQPVHRTQATRAAADEVQPLRRMEEEAQPLARLSPPDDQQLTAENGPKPASLSSMDDQPPVMTLRREQATSGPAPTAPAMIEAGPLPQSVPAPAPFEPFEQSFAEPDTQSTARFDPPHQAPLAPQGPAKVVIDQVDVVIHEPARATPAASPMADLSAMARRRYLGSF